MRHISSLKKKTISGKIPVWALSPIPAHLAGAARKNQSRNNFIHDICHVFVYWGKSRRSQWSCLGCVTAAHLSISQSHGAPTWLVSNVIPGSWFLCCDFLPVHLNLPWHQCPSFFAWPGQALLPGHGHSPSSSSTVRVLCQKSINKHTHTRENEEISDSGVLQSTQRDQLSPNRPNGAQFCCQGKSQAWNCSGANLIQLQLTGKCCLSRPHNTFQTL